MTCELRREVPTFHIELEGLTASSYHLKYAPNLLNATQVYFHQRNNIFITPSVERMKFDPSHIPITKVV